MVVERKNCYCLKVAHSMMFANSMTDSYWGEAILTTPYLINHRLSKILAFWTVDRLKYLHYFPHTCILNSLS